MKRVITIFGFILFAFLSRAQEQKISRSIEDLLEATGENMSDDTDIQEILDDWENLQENPINVNSATKEDFQKLHFLSDVQINNLIAYRNKSGTIYTLYELAAVDGLNQDILQKIEPFLSFEDRVETQGTKRSSTDLLFRANRTFNSQTDQSKYEGSPEKYYVRMKHESAKYEYGVIAEKDPGETFLRKSNKQGFDYNSGFVNFGIGQNNRLFLGDYSVRFGQGLVAWQGFSMGKSVETTQVFRTAPGVRSYTSTDENQFFRGIAAQIKRRIFTFSPFVSYHKVDASIDTIAAVRYFGALQTTGYHRTKTEVENEKSLGQFAAGTNLFAEYGNWSVGGTVVYTRFNALMDRSDEPYNQFLPEGRDNLVAGIDWRGSVHKVYVFGETAFTRNAGRAFISGITTNPAQNAEFSLVYRNINKTYFSYFANAFTESSRTNDEHALYLGFKVFPVSRITFQGYVDFFKFRWIKYTTAAPSDGTEVLAQLSYVPSRATNCYLRFFQEEKGQRVIDGNKKYDVPQKINRIRFNYAHDVSEQLSLKSRIELSFYSKLAKEKGFLAFQDISFSPLQKTYSLNARLAYFSTDGYNSRLYAYENDLLYSFAIPAFYDRGIRAYFNFRKDFGRRITAWFKVAETIQLPVDDGVEVSSSSGKTEVKFQVRYSF